MKRLDTSLVTVLLLVTSLTVIPTAACAQAAFVEGRFGVALPGGDLAEIERAGPVFGGGLGIFFTPRFSARLDVDASFMEGKRLDNGFEAPGINLVHYVAGLEAVVASPNYLGRSVDIYANLGAGGTRLEVEAFVAPSGLGEGQTYASSENYLTATGGLRLGYELSRSLELMISGQAYRVFADPKDTATLGAVTNGSSGIGSAWAFPITAGMRLRL